MVKLKRKSFIFINWSRYNLTNCKLEYIKQLFIKEYGSLSFDIMTLFYSKNGVDYKIWKIKEKYFIHKLEKDEV